MVSISLKHVFLLTPIVIEQDMPKINKVAFWVFNFLFLVGALVCVIGVFFFEIKRGAFFAACVSLYTLFGIYFCGIILQVLRDKKIRGRKPSISVSDFEEVFVDKNVFLKFNNIIEHDDGLWQSSQCLAIIIAMKNKKIIRKGINSREKLCELLMEKYPYKLKSQYNAKTINNSCDSQKEIEKWERRIEECL